MARSLSNMVLKGIEQLRPTPFVKMGTINSAYKYGRQWSTTITGDPDSHEDFRPANKLANSGSSVQEVVENDVKGNHIMIYMKGVPEAPRCGFSALAVRVLQEYGIPFSARNILENTELKNGVKAFRSLVGNMWRKHFTGSNGYYSDFEPTM
ncbi:monothiol glutaredoxin-S15, mitochondrial isoform X1 [Amborella trichopoda]|uniref:monothiol glutaredoxin-S15, mitochondrial isoform X1 n=1 Tax=Amborella trichopoda TaxID=13333 RepID=UPI0009BE3248|nr:monothiol glutaredoxin-S15, mitochondrial isoform X1 [Amborella trichopoda]|eukprot:XP_020528105.1 monothiol glutaredoxin-S15, mitochondrial isoform X1 [Amborella trichopoda]